MNRSTDIVGYYHIKHLRTGDIREPGVAGDGVAQSVQDTLDEAWAEAEAEGGVRYAFFYCLVCVCVCV